MNLSFRNPFVFKQEPEKTLPTNELAWADASLMYSFGDFEKYNPDRLIGKKGYAIYQEMMHDEQVKAVIKFKRDAITSRSFIFELDFDKHGISQEEAEKRIDLSYSVIDKIDGSWMDSLNGIFSANQNGYSMTEKIFGQIEYDNKTWWGIDRLKLKPYDTFVFKTDEYGNSDRVIQKIAGKEQEIDISKFIHFVVNPDVDEQYGLSELRAAYRAWFSKNNIIKFRNIWLERHAGGFRMAQIKDGQTISANSAEYATLKNIMANMQTSTGMIVPAKVEMKGEYPANNVAFKEAIDDYNIDISRALLVPNLLGITPSGNTGSFSQSTNQLDAFLWTLEADSKRAEEAINEQLFRQLAEVNFGDDAWPRFKFNPISESKKTELVSTWKDLVSSGAVRRTEADESHTRQLMGYPEASEEDIIDDNENDKDDGDNTDVGSNADNVDVNNNDSSGNSDEVDTELSKKEKQDETILGKGVVTVSAFSKAEKRVSFAVIDKSSASIEEEYTMLTVSVMDSMFDDLITKSKDAGSLDGKVNDNIKALKPNKQLQRKLKDLQVKMLKESFSVGTKHAKFEIDKAKKENFSRNFNSERFDLIADDYFKIRAFKIAGDFTDDAVKTIENEILNGTKFDKTWPEVEQAIYSAAATKGLISEEQAKEALGEALGVADPDARIRTVIRTSSWDAINEARHTYFTDPDLDGFVIAFEYSAILDSRTTDICKHLDAGNRGNHSLEWYASNPKYKPPNHYNCRSLLTPVTTADEEEYVEGKQPTIQPQKGFG